MYLHKAAGFGNIGLARQTITSTVRFEQQHSAVGSSSVSKTSRNLTLSTSCSKTYHMFLGGALAVAHAKRTFLAILAPRRGTIVSRSFHAHRSELAKTSDYTRGANIALPLQSRSSTIPSRAPSVMDNKIEVLLHGLGAIGAFYAFILQRCKNVRLSVTARSNYEAVKANGLLVKSDNHGEHHFYPAATLKTLEEAGHPFDFIVCANKATDLDVTAKQLAPAADQDRTTIVLMQNGVGNEDPFHKEFPECPIVSGVVSLVLPLIDRHICC